MSCIANKPPNPHFPGTVFGAVASWYPTPTLPGLGNNIYPCDVFEIPHETDRLVSSLAILFFLPRSTHARGGFGRVGGSGGLLLFFLVVVVFFLQHWLLSVIVVPFFFPFFLALMLLFLVCVGDAAFPPFCAQPDLPTKSSSDWVD